MSFFLFNNKPDLSLIFNIRDSVISIGAVRFEKDKKPDLILCQNFKIKNSEPDNHKKYVSSMFKVLDKSILSIRKGLAKIGNKEKIGKHYFFLGSPWCVSKAKTIKISKDKPFEINSQLLDKVIIGEEFSSEEDIEGETNLLNWKVLEQRIIQSKINGYKVEEIYGKKASNLAIELFVSFLPFEIKDKLDLYINDRLGKNVKRQSNSCTLSAYTFLRDLYEDKNDFIYVDVGEFITDVSVVRDDVIFGTGSFPFGEKNIIEVAMRQSNIPEEVFKSSLSIMSDKRYDTETTKKTEDLLDKGLEIWENKFKDIISKICTEMNVPNNLFIIPNSLVSNILVKDFARKVEANNFEILDSQMSINTISDTVFNSFVINGKVYNNEPYVKMDIIFLDKILKNNK